MRAHELAVIIQKCIATGKYKPEDRIPTRQELADMFSVSSVTVQRAINILIEQQFLVARKNHGTFVCEFPPNLSSFVLMLPRKLGNDVSGNMFRRLLSNEAKKVNKKGKTKIELFEGYMEWRNLDKYNKIVKGFEEDKFAGVIFVIQPLDFIDTPLLSNKNIARVAISSKQEMSNVPVVFYDVSDFLDKSLNYLKEQGCVKPAYIGGPYNMKRTEMLLDLLASPKNMRIHPENIQSVSLETVEWGYRLTKLLMNQEKTHRPDSIIIGDDNLFAPIASALKDLGIRPDKFKLVTHANSPSSKTNKFPALHLGVKSETFLNACIECLQMQKTRGGWEQLPQMETFLPVHELK